MRPIIYTLFAIVACTCVLIIFVAPSIDLPQTALRAYHSALLLMSSFLFAALVLLTRLLDPESVCELFVHSIVEQSQRQRLVVSVPVLRC
jgi:hypothetical protein